MPSPSEPGFDGPILLPAHCSTVVADDLRIRMVLASDQADTIVIDASEVESVGQAVLQLLIAARAEAERNAGAMSIINPSSAFADRVAEFGLSGAIGLSSAEEIQ